MYEVRYAKAQDDSLILADNVEYYKLAIRKWYFRTTLGYANLHEGFEIWDSHDVSALYFRFSDGTAWLVEWIETHFDAPGVAFGMNPYPWQVRVKCKGFYGALPVGQAKHDIMDLYLERLALELGKANLLKQY